MVNLLLNENLFSIFQVITVFLVGTILLFTFKAYRMTSQPFLINFFIGFTLLEVSFGFVFLNILFGRDPLAYGDTLWVHQITQTTAFASIASTYYLKNRNTTMTAAGALALAFLSTMSLTIAIYFAFPPKAVFPSPEAVDEYLYTFGLAFLAYIVYHTVRASAIPRKKSNALVPAGFGIFALGQVSWVFWSLGEDGGILLLANLSLVVGLVLFIIALTVVLRR